MELECVCARSTIYGGVPLRVPPPEWPWCSATDSAVDPGGMPSSSLVVVISREAPWVSAPPLNWPLGDEQQFLSGITSTRSFSREYEYKDHSHFWAPFSSQFAELNRDFSSRPAPAMPVARASHSPLEQKSPPKNPAGGSKKE